MVIAILAFMIAITVQCERGMCELSQIKLWEPSRIQSAVIVILGLVYLQGW